MTALSVRRVGATLGLAGVLLSGAMTHGGVGPVASAAGHRAGWRIVPSPSGPRGLDNTLVQVSAGSAASAWAVGYDGAAGNFHTLIERWNGSKWATVRSPDPSPLDNVLAGVATQSPRSAWAVGYQSVNVSPIAYHRALIEHWNGITWRVVPTPKAGPSDSDLWGVTALSATNAWAVGNANIGTFPTFRFRPLVEHWNGHAWTLVPVPSPKLTGVGASLDGVAAISPRNIWAVGSYAVTGTRFQPLIEHWNGARWALVPAPAAGSAELGRISFQSPGNGWAVGSRGAAPHTQAVIEHWDGQRWLTVSSPVISGSSLTDVLALTPHLAWAVGDHVLRNGDIHTLIERWNGRSWTVVPSPNRRPSSELLGIAGTRQHIWATGDSLTATLILNH